MMFRHHGMAREISKPTDVGKTLHRLSTYLRPFRGLLLLTLSLVILTSALRLAGPYLIGVATDQFPPSNSKRG